jgi:hypothetical protein
VSAVRLMFLAQIAAMDPGGFAGVANFHGAFGDPPTVCRVTNSAAKRPPFIAASHNQRYGYNSDIFRRHGSNRLETVVLIAVNQQPVSSALEGADQGLFAQLLGLRRLTVFPAPAAYRRPIPATSTLL